MIKTNSLWLSVFADLLINLSATFLAAVVVVPNFSGIESPYGVFVLTADIFSATLCLFLTKYLRELNNKHD